MSQQDYYNRCGNCTSFRFEGDGIKGYCSYYRAYCYPNDTCLKQENASSSSAGCFLTTVCCKEKGLPDDCKELTVLRKFRDEVLKTSERGREMIEFYYREAPRIVKQIESHREKEKICDAIFEKIHEVITKYETGNLEDAKTEYLWLMYQADLLSR